MDQSSAAPPLETPKDPQQPELLNVSTNVAAHTVQVAVKGPTGSQEKLLTPESGPFKDQGVQSPLLSAGSSRMGDQPQFAEKSEGGGIAIQTSSKTLPRLKIDKQSVMSSRNG